MKLHYNKPYNFVKGLTITEIITFAGIIILFATAIIDPESFDSVGGMIK